MKANCIELIDAAVGDQNGLSSFYEDTLTGQNSSLVKNFSGLNYNKKNAYVESSVLTRKVRTVTLDQFFSKRKTTIDFIKIDIEGYEWNAIKGAKMIISKCKPVMMIEIQASRQELFNYLSEQEYILFDDSLNVKFTSTELNGNIFCLHSVKHKKFIQYLGL